MKFIEAWKRGYEWIGDLQPLKEALNIAEKESSTSVKHRLTLLQYLTEDENGEDLVLVTALADLIKKYGATTPMNYRFYFNLMVQKYKLL